MTSLAICKQFPKYYISGGPLIGVSRYSRWIRILKLAVHLPYIFTMVRVLSLLAAAGSAAATILWDGRFNEFTSSTDLNNWSWSNQVGPYQYYIVSHFLPASGLLDTEGHSTVLPPLLLTSTSMLRTRTLPTLAVPEVQRSRLTAQHTGTARQCAEPS
jgi:hypothetical protein